MSADTPSQKSAAPLFVEMDGTRIHYRFGGPADAPVLVFSNSLGTDLSMWDPQVPAIDRKFRVLRYDTRGHGLSSAPPGPYTIDQLGNDVLRLLDALRIQKAAFCGLSMGGMIGMWLGVNAAARLRKLVLCNTAAKIGTAETWNGRIEMVTREGMGPVADAVLKRWYTPDFVLSAPQEIERTRRMLLHSSPEGYAANCAAIRDMDQRETISRIHTPTLIIAGANDPVTTPADARFLLERIQGARYVELNAAHLSNIEAAQPFTDALSNFLSGPEAN